MKIEEKKENWMQKNYTDLINKFLEQFQLDDIPEG